MVADREPAPVVRLEDDRPVTHHSFSAWLEAWRASGLRPREMDRDALTVSPPRFTTAASIARWWSQAEKWVRPMYEQAG